MLRKLTGLFQRGDGHRRSKQAVGTACLAATVHDGQGANEHKGSQSMPSKRHVPIDMSKTQILDVNTQGLVHDACETEVALQPSVKSGNANAHIIHAGSSPLCDREHDGPASIASTELQSPTQEASAEVLSGGADESKSAPLLTTTACTTSRGTQHVSMFPDTDIEEYEPAVDTGGVDTTTAHFQLSTAEGLLAAPSNGRLVASCRMAVSCEDGCKPRLSSAPATGVKAAIGHDASWGLAILSQRVTATDTSAQPFRVPRGVCAADRSTESQQYACFEDAAERSPGDGQCVHNLLILGDAAPIELVAVTAIDKGAMHVELVPHDSGGVPPHGPNRYPAACTMRL
eukprot:jgi/Ulvmu1/3215/UM015_0256.1